MADDTVTATEADAAQRLRQGIQASDAGELDALVASLGRQDALREVLFLTAAERARLMELLSPEQGALLVEEAPNEVAVDLVETLAAPRAAEIIDELDSDVQADLIGELDDDNAEAILAEMDADDAADVRRLVEYDDETAGGLMVAEAFTFATTDTVGDVLRRLASEEDDFERYRGQHPYIIDEAGAPVGVVSLRNLLTAKRAAPLTSIMVAPLTVSVTTQLDALRTLFDAHPFLGLPVVEADGRLVGVVSRAAVDFAALERAEADSLKRQGVVGDEVRSLPFLLRSRRRLAWLSANIVLNIMAASVIASYEQTLAAVIAIAVFLPMVSDMSGCSGNQAVAVTMRELALRLVRPADALWVAGREVTVGAFNGIIVGTLIGLVAWAWKGNPYLGLVIGVALAANTVIAVLIGGTVPLLLKAVKQDPAVASGPLLTTVTDIMGFFLVLSLATLMMPYLV